ncbi:ABC transporter permease [Streptomyces sp. NPDC054796]
MSEQHHPPHGAHGRRPARGAAWRTFKESPFFPATVLVLIVAAAAGLFAGSYTYAMADPTPHHIPMAVVGTVDSQREARAFTAGMEKALGSSLEVRRYPTDEKAEQAVEAQEVFTVLRVEKKGRVEMDISSASGASVAQLLEKAGPKVGKAVGVDVTVKDLKPLAKGDPRGLAIFYISLAAVIIGFVGAIQLSVHARALNPPERIAFTVAYALLGGFVIAAIVDWGLDAVQLPFVQSWLILALTMFTSGMVFTMFNTLFGRWAMIPTWGLMVLLGNPSSGGAVSWPLLPSVLGTIGRWLPPGASVNAQHTAVYFPGYQHIQPYLVLAAWAVASCTVFWLWRHRHPGGRPKGGVHAEG